MENLYHSPDPLGKAMYCTKNIIFTDPHKLHKEYNIGKSFLTIVAWIHAMKYIYEHKCDDKS